MYARVLTATALIVATLATSSIAGEPPPLKDQYGHGAALTDYSGEPVLAIVVSTRKLRWIGQWEAALRAEIPQLVSVRVADVTDEPRPGYEQVAEALRRRVPEDVSVLIDTQNLWATSFELDTSEPCLVLFDRDHNVVAKFRGRPKGELVDGVMAAGREFFGTAVES